MKDLGKLLTVIAAAIVIKRLIDGKPACVSVGPFKACNY